MKWLPGTRLQHYPHQATYWAHRQPDGYGAEAWVAPEIIRCRWELNTTERSSNTFGSAAGNSQVNVADSIVYVQKLLLQGGYLFFGVTTLSDPASDSSCFIIRTVTGVPSLRGQFSEYAARL
jgi:hypothetical protein